MVDNMVRRGLKFWTGRMDGGVPTQHVMRELVSRSLGFGSWYKLKKSSEIKFTGPVGRTGHFLGTGTLEVLREFQARNLALDTGQDYEKCFRFVSRIHSDMRQRRLHYRQNKHWPYSEYTQFYRDDLE